jgi:hypothetical protein
MLEDFKREIMMLSKIDNENIVKLLGYCDQRNNTYLVSELMEGGSLFDHIKNKNNPKFHWSINLKLIKDITAGMVYLHSNSRPASPRVPADAGMWWRRHCAQTRRRRPAMVPRAGPELKSSQKFRKAQWHHLRIGSNMSWSKAYLLVRTANRMRDHATCARISTLQECT